MDNILMGERFMTVGESGYVTSDDVLFLRQQVYKDGIVSKTELNSLLGLAERAPEGDLEWAEFFGEVAADYYFREELPHDYITESAFIDLKSHLTRYGETVTPLMLSMVIMLVSKSTASPPAMSEFIIEQIRSAIQERHEDPVITAQDVVLIRNFLFASGGDGNVMITRAEATLLFDLNDMTICSDNHVSWSELFVKAIANHIMGYIGYVAPSREEALAQWEWMQDTNINIAGFFKRMVSGSLSTLQNIYSPSDNQNDKATDNTFDKILKSRLSHTEGSASPQDASWLTDRIGRDGIMDDNERAVIAYIRDLSTDLPTTLQALLEPAA